MNKDNQKQQELSVRLENIERFSTTQTDTDMSGSKQKRGKDGLLN